MLDTAIMIPTSLDFEMPEDHMFIAGCSRLPSRASVESNLQCPLDQTTMSDLAHEKTHEPGSQ